jgi:glycosyltransferase involved in cell wall biosynthesis
MGIRILHLITSLEGGGTENFLYQILARSPEGYDHQVIYLKKDGVIGDRIRRHGFSVERAGSLPALYRQLHTFQPRILHTCLYSAHQIGRCLGRMARVPAILTSQRSIDLWQKPWQAWLDRKTLPFCDGVMVNSRAAAEVIRRRRGSRPYPELFEIPNGVDPKRFKLSDARAARTRYRLPEEAVVGGSLMRLHGEKGADFIPAFASQLLPDNPRLHLLIGGVGPFEASLKRQIAGTSYADRIHWVGWEEDTPGFLSACDFYWSLSREESFPQTLVEASFMGLPWVAPQVGGVPELISAGAAGLTFQRLDIAAAVRQTGQLLKDLPASSQKAQKNRPLLETAYALEKMVDHVYDVFRRYG